MRWLDSITDSMEMISSKLQEIMEDRGSLVEKEMATHSSILAWKSPWTEEPGGLQSMGFT